MRINHGDFDSGGRVDVGILELWPALRLTGPKVGTGLAIPLIIPFNGELGFLLVNECPISEEREWGSLCPGGSWVFWSRKVREGRVFSEDLKAELPQLLLGHGQPHIKDFEHLKFDLSNVPATESAGDIRPIAVGVGEIEGILCKGANVSGERKISDHEQSREKVKCCELW